MNCYFPQVVHHRVRFFILVLLKETKDQIKKEKQLDEFINIDLENTFGLSKCSLVCLRKSVINGRHQHQVIKVIFPITSLLDNNFIEEVLI